jgi:hypothetical protein
VIAWLPTLPQVTSELRNRGVAIAAIVLGTACARAVTEPTELRLELARLQVPSTVSAGAPFTVNLRYGIGACQRVTAVAGRLDGRTLEIEVRGRDVPIPPGTACIAILYLRDTTFTAVAPSPGDLTVVGLQPRGEHLSERVLVSGG